MPATTGFVESTARRESRRRSRERAREKRREEASRTPLTDEQIRERHGALVVAALDAFRRDPDYVIKMAEDGRIASRRSEPEHVAIAFAIELRNAGLSAKQITSRLNAEGFRNMRPGNQLPNRVWGVEEIARQMRRYS